MRSRSACILIVFLCWSFPGVSAVRGGVLHVDDNGAGDPGPGNPAISDPLENGSAEHPFDRIQEAIAAAVAGDVVLVEPGSYGGGLNLLGKAITLRSASGPEGTTIDGGTLAVIRCVSGETRATVIEGFTIRNGNASGLAGGISCTGSSPTIRGNILVANHGGQGGAIGAMSGSNPLIVGNTIEDNNGAGGGAGLYCEDSAATLRGNRLARNVAELEVGGAVHAVRSQLVVIDNEFVENLGLGGAAIHVFDCGAVDVRRNRFIRNDGVTLFAGFSGAVSWINSAGILSDNLFFENRGDSGGAVSIGDSSPEWRNNSVVATRQSSGGGGNSAVFVYGASSLVIRSSIFWGNAPLSAIDWSATSDVQVAYCDIEGGATGAGNIDVDPQFLNLGGGDLHLRGDSPCRDAGDPGLPVAAGDADVDGDPRIVGGRVDIGADEFLPGGDLDFDGAVTSADAELFVAVLLGLESDEQRVRLSDFSGDGGVDGEDVQAFVVALELH